MLLNLLSSLFFSNKIYMAASLNKHYIAGSRAIFIVITATLIMSSIITIRYRTLVQSSILVNSVSAY